ncbi:MAG TPA: MFS transporter [Polyangiaceae bacterium]|nr:MFS transporter [Polyangiaceae bacterium]
MSAPDLAPAAGEGGAKPAPFPRIFYVANALELLERFAFYGVYVNLVVYLHDEVRLDDVESGGLLGLFALVRSWLPVPVGSLADRLGFRKSLVLSFALYVGAYALLFALPARPTAYAAVMGMAVGGSFLKPVVPGCVQRYAPPERRATGFAIFYATINAGSVVGKSLAKIVRTAVSLRATIVTSVVACAFALGVTLAAFREPGPAPGEPGGPPPATRSAREELARVASALRNLRLVAFLTLVSGYYLLLEQFYQTFPTYCVRVFGEGAPREYITLINPLAIATLQIFAARLTQRLEPLAAMIGGICLGALSMLVMGAFPSIAGACAAYFVFACAEMVYSPRFYEYVGSFAPRGQEGLYMGIAFVPQGVGGLAGGVLSGRLIAQHLPKGGPHDPLAVWGTYAALGVGCALVLLAFRALGGRRPAAAAALPGGGAVEEAQRAGQAAAPGALVVGAARVDDDLDALGPVAARPQALADRVYERPEVPAPLARARVEVDARGVARRGLAHHRPDGALGEPERGRHADGAAAELAPEAEVREERGEPAHRRAAHDDRLGAGRDRQRAPQRRQHLARHPPDERRGLAPRLPRGEGRELVQPRLAAVLDPHDDGRPRAEAGGRAVGVPAARERGRVVEDVLPVEQHEQGAPPGGRGPGRHEHAHPPLAPPPGQREEQALEAAGGPRGADRGAHGASNRLSRGTICATAPSPLIEPSIERPEARPSGPGRAKSGTKRQSYPAARSRSESRSWSNSSSVSAGSSASSEPAFAAAWKRSQGSHQGAPRYTSSVRPAARARSASRRTSASAGSAPPGAATSSTPALPSTAAAPAWPGPAAAPAWPGPAATPGAGPPGSAPATSARLQAPAARAKPKASGPAARHLCQKIMAAGLARG